jgi:hypothetical protein
MLMAPRFRWIDRAGAVALASAEYRNAAEDGDPIGLDVACGRAIGCAGGPLAGRFCTTPELGDRRWEEFKADVSRDVSRILEVERFLAREDGEMAKKKAGGRAFSRDEAEFHGEMEATLERISDIFRDARDAGQRGMDEVAAIGAALRAREISRLTAKN